MEITVVLKIIFLISPWIRGIGGFWVAKKVDNDMIGYLLFLVYWTGKHLVRGSNYMNLVFLQK